MTALATITGKLYRNHGPESELPWPNRKIRCTWITNNWILNKGPASTSVRTNQATYGMYILGGTAGYSKAGTKYRNPYIALVLP